MISKLHFKLTLPKINFLFWLFLFCTALSSPVFGDEPTVVDKHGQLRVDGNKMVDEEGNPVSLRGMSFFWSQWEGARFYNAGCVEWLRDDWECTVVRAAMGVESGGYLQNPLSEKNKVKAVVEASINLGIYVIIDWHDHNAQNHLQQAKEFFAEMAELYGDYPNVIYEIFNEPLQVSWTNVIKPYAEAVIDTIRSIDPDNIIIVGTPTWSQDVDIASQNPLDDDNVVYTLHFYAATHKQFLRDKAVTALNNGIALFVSEFGTVESSGTGFLDSAETDTWINFLEARDISWCNWSVVDKNETSAALRNGSGASSTGGWPLSSLTPSGSLIRGKIKALTPVLPVELISFTANISGDFVELNWSTATEVNNRGFEILRKKINERGDETEWGTVGFIEGKGTITEIQKYSFIDKGVSKGRYIYKLKQIDFNGNFSFSNEVEISFKISGFNLYQNYPNPFNPETTIEYDLNDSGQVTLEVFDVNGSKIKTLTSDYKTSGNYKIIWDGINDKGVKVSSGVYFFHLTFDNQLQTKKALQLN